MTNVWFHRGEFFVFLVVMDSNQRVYKGQLIMLEIDDRVGGCSNQFFPPRVRLATIWPKRT